MRVRYLARRNEHGVIHLVDVDVGSVGLATTPEAAYEWISGRANEEGLTVFHRGVMARVREDGSHEVLYIAARM